VLGAPQPLPGLAQLARLAVQGQLFLVARVLALEHAQPANRVLPANGAPAASELAQEHAQHVQPVQAVSS